MGRWKKRAGLAAAGLITTAASFAVGQPPAGASTASGALTFVAYSGATETCSINVDASHQTNPARVSAGSGESGSFSDCFDVVDLHLQITYKDQRGQTQTVDSYAFATSSLSVSGAVSNVKVTLTASYFNCNPSQSATCDLAVTTSPK